MSKISEIGIRIKELREAKGLSQADLGQILGCAQTTIAGWEGAKKKMPRKEMLGHLAKALNVEESYLLGVKQAKFYEIPHEGILTSNKIIKNDVYFKEVSEEEYASNRFAIEIGCDSFEPIIFKNDICVFEESEPKNNDIVLVQLSKKILIKKWKQNKTRIVLVEINPQVNEMPIFVLLQRKNGIKKYVVENQKFEYKGKLVFFKRYII